MIKIERYSIDAFKPQKQTYHLQNVYFHLDENQFIDSCDSIPDHLKSYIVEKYIELAKFYKENYEDFLYGVWVFIAGHKNNQSLNHLKNLVPCYTAYLPEDTEVYSVNWDRKLKLSDDECTYFGCYVPKRSLGHIIDIRKKYRGGGR